MILEQASLMIFLRSAALILARGASLPAALALAEKSNALAVLQEHIVYLEQEINVKPFECCNGTTSSTIIQTRSDSAY